MSIPASATVDWALLREDLKKSSDLMEDTRALLSLEEQQRFDRLFLDFIWSNPPSVPETQATLRLIFTYHPVLLSKFSTFLSHPTTTPAECEEARAEFGRILHFPMLSFRPLIPGWSSEDFITALKDRLGQATLEHFAHIDAQGPRNTMAGIPTRPALLALLRGDEELVQRFNILWPKEEGDLWS